MKTTQNVYLFQCQYAIDVRGVTNYYLPYSIGCLYAYAKQFADIRQNFNFPELFFKREDPATVVARMEDAHICGFSNYVWNEQYHIELIRRIREKFPDVIIVFGGPQVGQDNVDNNDCDAWIQQEGERNFVNLLRDSLTGDIKPIYDGERIDDLVDLPSPYLTGVFDDIIAAHPDNVFSMTLETNRGCPFMCTFCDWGSLTYAKIKKHDLEKVVSELDWSIRNPIGYIWVADANFGVFRQRDIAIAHMLNYACTHPDSGIDAVNVQYYKNSTETAVEIAKIIGREHSRGITLSVQSMTTDVLEAIKRTNMDLNDLNDLIDKTTEAGVLCYSEVILPLPLETLDSWKTGLAELLECGQHSSIEMWKAQLLKNSELTSGDSVEKYGIEQLTVSDYSYYQSEEDWNEIPEKINIISATNTMSSEEVTKAYMYGWMIINLHTQGYLQILAKYCRNVLNVSYRQFYDKVFAELMDGTTEISDAFNSTMRIEQYYMKHGHFKGHQETESENEDLASGAGHFIASRDLATVFNRKNTVYEIGERIASTFGHVDPTIIKATRHSLADIENMGMGAAGSRTVTVNQETWEQGVTIDVAYDLDTWEHTPTSYLVKPSIPLSTILEVGAMHHRRQGFKNLFIKQQS
jgi:hypothetical protein